jgi:SAM-dependent methyltransferase
MNEIKRDLDRPEYLNFRKMLEEREPLAANFANQIIETTRPYLRLAVNQLNVLDIGSGYGNTALELARHCKHVVGIEPSTEMFDVANRLKNEAGIVNCEFRNEGIYDFREIEFFDLIVLDNVLEHLHDQPRALQIISQCLRRGGVAFILVPNKLWPIEVHYKLPFLSYLPLRLANFYLRMSGRGQDYVDASYAPTYLGVIRLFSKRPELNVRFCLPADMSLATSGNSWHYRLGAALIKRFPCFWAISKAFLLVAVKK